MNSVAAAIAYIPVIGWLYAFLTQRRDPFVMFHLRQGIGLVLFLIGAVVVWAVVSWVIAWIPYMAVIAVALFTIVIVVYLYGFIAWIMGMNNALKNRSVTLPFFGEWANRRLPIK